MYKLPNIKFNTQNLLGQRKCIKKYIYRYIWDIMALIVKILKDKFAASNLLVSWQIIVQTKTWLQTESTNLIQYSRINQMAWWVSICFLTVWTFMWHPRLVLFLIENEIIKHTHWFSWNQNYKIWVELFKHPCV